MPELSVKTTPSAGHHRAGGERATAPPRAHACMVTTLSVHCHAGALGRYWLLGQVGHVRPWAKSGPCTIPHFFFSFPISFWFKNSRELDKVLKCMEIRIKLKKYEIHFLRIIFSR
jgi:hypothetical protein